jgi:phage shock protein A
MHPVIVHMLAAERIKDMEGRAKQRRLSREAVRSRWAAAGAGKNVRNQSSLAKTDRVLRQLERPLSWFASRVA